ncbi:GFA family protein [Sneathiella sp.]|uniref:GFA family protein n=1 Tax=Sneathiella sp. TaxID=1964365 RepID=UPI002FE38D54
MAESYTGTCFCGAIELRVEGAPVAMGYCHCSSCRKWSAAPVSTYTLWPEDAVALTRGADRLATYSKTPSSLRQFCKSCGGHVMTTLQGAGLIDVYASTIPDLEFIPSAHVNYAEAVLKVRDGLPKLKDFPAEAGGSGELMAE